MCFEGHRCFIDGKKIDVSIQVYEYLLVTTDYLYSLLRGSSRDLQERNS